MSWKKRSTQPRPRPRFLKMEALEGRSLLAGVVGSAWQNPLECSDLNGDGAVSPVDALTAINAINGGGSGQLIGRFGLPSKGGIAYVDANGDGALSPSDPLMVINALNGGTTNEDDSADDPTTEDEQPEGIGDDAPLIEFTNGLARVRSALNAAGDIDVYRVDATADQLHVAVFSRIRGDVTVSVVDAEGAVLGTASTADGERQHAASVTVDVAEGETYFVIVSGDEVATGVYCLQAIHTTVEAEEAPTTDGGTSEEDEESDERPQPLTAEEMFTVLDADTDGSLTAEEFAVLQLPTSLGQTSAEVFTLLDADASSGLSLEEFSALAAPPREGGHGGPGGHGQGAHRGPGGQRGPGGPHGSGGGPFDSPTESDETAMPEEVEAASQRRLAVDEVFAAWDSDTSGSLSLIEFQGGIAARRLR